MRASVFVGRVGGLAIALGIGSGVAIGGVGAAWAAPGASDSATDADSASDATSTRSISREPSGRQRAGRSTRGVQKPAVTSSPQSGDPEPVEVAPASTLGRAGRASAVLPPEVVTSKDENTAVAETVGPASSVPAPSLSDEPGVFSTAGISPVMVMEPAAPAAPPAAIVLAAPPAEQTGTTVVPPVMVPTPRQSAAESGVVESVLAPVSGTGPVAPVESAVSWVMLAVARRELGNLRAMQGTPATMVATEPPLDDAAVPNRAATRTGIPAPAAAETAVQTVDPVAAATAADPITAFVEQIQAFVTGVVTAITQVVNQVVQAVTQVVTAIVNIFVPVPANNAPIAEDPTVGTPDAGTGVVTGVVTASDPDGDAVTYSAPASTAKGAVVIDAATGEFAYTPADAARHAAAAFNATNAERSDSFTVTITDAKGSTTTAVVTVAISASNAAPIAGIPVVGSPDELTGVVIGSVSATDADGDALTFSGSTTTAKGSVVVNSDGEFTYTPTEAARHQAASEGAVAVDLADSFTVTVADGHGGTATTAVNVAISPVNAAPVAGTPVVGTPDASTGVVVGTVTATDADGDALTFSGSTTTPKGSVVVNADGGFTYTPTATARHAAAGDGAEAADLTDSFTVTVADGFGGTTTAVVTVAVSPANTDPVAGTPTVGTPDASTGVVTGSVTATDADGDVLTYSGSAATAKGSVVVDADGGFTYTPTVDARNDAASAGATGADRSDNFTVTIADGHGGLASVPVTVPVSPVAQPSTVTVGLTTGDIVVSEGNSGSQQVPVTVALSEVSTGPVTVDYTITSVDFGGTATAGEDFVAATGSVVIAPGQTQVRVPVTVYGDTKYEGQEVFYVKLTSATGAAIVTPGAEGQRTDFARLYITNDDQPSTVTVGLTTGDIVVSEGNSGSQQVPVTVALSEVSTGPVTVDYTITSVDFGGTATAGEDFVAATGSVVIAPGQTQVRVPVTVYGDTKYEGQEVFYVKLTSATGAAIVTPGAEGQRTDFARLYITNDDQLTVVASLNPYEENYFDEGDSGTTIAPVTVTLSGPSSETVTVDYTVDSSLSTAGVDFAAATGTLVFSPGQTEASIPVTIYGDTDYEGEEAVTITLTGATNAVVDPDLLGPTRYYKYIYIRNDDAAPTV